MGEYESTSGAENGHEIASGQRMARLKEPIGIPSAAEVIFQLSKG